VLPVGPAQDAMARDLHDRLISAGLRPRVDADGSLGARIRRARRRRDCLIAVLGEAEAAAGAAQVTDIAAGFSGQVAAGDLVRLAAGAHGGRRARIDWASAVGEA
jgi:threonyl-tRNA synthetase